MNLRSEDMRVTAEPSLRHYWYPVAFASDLGDAPLARRLLGSDLMVKAIAPVDDGTCRLL
ncbi:hypothetical protein BCD48_25850 [Pseudofrankia sp. BMG5.36]|nr:hypothetical protein BCD48_25850 [Pseudofrankia sp. BMG5.36]